MFNIKDYREPDRVFRGYANKGMLTNIGEALADGVYYYIIYTDKTVDGQIIKHMDKGYLILKR